MDEIKKFTNYQAYKQELDTELTKTAEGFVRIGYLLKQARDTDILEESGYKNYIEFAQAEYNIDKTTVSRFVRINDKFSEDGNSDQLQEQYKGFGYAKLAIMLQLPDSINEELSPNFSKAEVQAIKEEVAEEEKVSDIERMLEPVPKELAQVDDTLQQAIIALGKQEPELYLAIHDEAKISQGIEVEKLKDDIAPNEEAMYSIRIPGTGRMLLSLKTDGKNTLMNVRSGEKTEYTWEEIADAWKLIVNLEEDAKKEWEERYGESWPVKEKVEVAPVQPKKQEPKKQSKVIKAKEKPKVEEKEEVAQTETPQQSQSETEISQNSENEENGTPESLHDIDESIPVPEPLEPKTEDSGFNEEADHEEEQLPGQMEVADFPQYMPEPVDNSTENSNMSTKNKEKCTDSEEMITEEVELVTGTVENAHPDFENDIEELKPQMVAMIEIIQQEIDKLRDNVDEQRWAQALMDLDDIEFKIKKAREIEEAEEEE